MLGTQWQFAAGRRRTVGADKQYDTHELRRGHPAPRVHAARQPEREAPGRQRDRWPHDAPPAIGRVKPVGPGSNRFGWLKTLAGLRKVKLRGLDKVDRLFVFAVRGVQSVAAT